MSQQDWVRRDLAHLWHPCTQMQDHEQVPLIPIRRGSGVWLEDFAGQRYLDAISSWWVNLFGHANPRINAAISAQLDRLEHVLLAGFSHEGAICLAEALVARAPPGINRCFYVDNGSSAVEAALKLSFHYWRNLGETRTRFLTLSNSYHGETLGALAVGDLGLYRNLYAPLLLQAMTTPAPDSYLCPAGSSPAEHLAQCIAALEQTLASHAHDLCAFIVEPLVQCAGGMRMYPAAYLRAAHALCQQYRVLFIADEVATGFGRTGTFWGCEPAGITPDLLCTGKGLTGGYLPLAAVLTTETLYQAFYADYASQRAFLHSHSYAGNPLACAAALATLAIFAEDAVLVRNQTLAAKLAVAAAPLAALPHVAQVRQQGLILAFELAPDGDRCQVYPWQERRGLRAYQYALTQGELLRPLGNVLYWLPPYVIQEDEIALLAQVTAGAIAAATI